ncbi:hypothetical protein SAMN05216188_12238 [Lentzea xinjiangensis]|uniref:Uncharacterized protein n=1 Tax=Lentzea xinjiangensis TaxID=402600 RepID=A0A1H9UPM0_9PSEU|nr:hypothetical protein SAMN05216188_12238 [Lentzea xinjiangensis]
MRRTGDRIAQWVAFAVLAAGVVTLVVLGLSL